MWWTVYVIILACLHFILQYLELLKSIFLAQKCHQEHRLNKEFISFYLQYHFIRYYLPVSGT